ncbi:hypothetical protein NN561_005902 [Cricetulus griseus]
MFLPFSSFFFEEELGWDAMTLVPKTCRPGGDSDAKGDRGRPLPLVRCGRGSQLSVSARAAPRKASWEAVSSPRPRYGVAEGKMVRARESWLPVRFAERAGWRPAAGGRAALLAGACRPSEASRFP